MAAGKNLSITSLVSIYLVVNGNKLSHRMQHIFTCKDWQSHWIFHQLIQHTLPLTLCCVFSSCVFLHIVREMAQWCSGMFSALYRCWYTS